MGNISSKTKTDPIDMLKVDIFNLKKKTEFL
jgi:hypothetical protein